MSASPLPSFCQLCVVRPPGSTTSIKRCRGFTLLELLLAMAILSMIAAIAIPQIGWMLGDRRLARGADQLRIEMAELRIKAMREGRIMMIRASDEVEGGIEKLPYHSMADATEALDLTGSQTALLTGADAATSAGVVTADAAEVEPEVIELPEDVTVQTIGVVSSARAMYIQEELLAQGSMHQPILFYPDGSTSTAAVVLVHKTHGQITVELRGLTGDVTIGNLQAGDGT